ncbi:hypothetical protein MMC10_000359 [Thelotrema lepadinum]|nr:hypothetical protein [Thelotrema lepadinum]
MAASITSAPASTSTITIPHDSIYTIPTTTLPTFACDEDGQLETAPENNAVGLEPLYNVTFNWLESCCNGAPVVAYQDGCAGYCTAKGQNVNQLYSCLGSSLSAATGVAAPFIMACNGCSQSSTSGVAAATGSVTTTTTAASGSSTAAQSSNAAAAGLSEGGVGVGKMALGVMSILVASIFAGATIL